MATLSLYNIICIEKLRGDWRPAGRARSSKGVLYWVPAEIVPNKKIDLGKNIENSSGTGFGFLSAEMIFAPNILRVPDR